MGLMRRCRRVDLVDLYLIVLAECVGVRFRVPQPYETISMMLSLGDCKTQECNSIDLTKETLDRCGGVHGRCLLKNSPSQYQLHFRCPLRLFRCSCSQVHSKTPRKPLRSQSRRCHQWLAILHLPRLQSTYLEAFALLQHQPSPNWGPLLIRRRRGILHRSQGNPSSDSNLP